MNESREVVEVYEWSFCSHLSAAEFNLGQLILHWRIQGGAPRRAPPPRDPIFSFQHTNFMKRSHLWESTPPPPLRGLYAPLREILDPLLFWSHYPASRSWYTHCSGGSYVWYMSKHLICEPNELYINKTDVEAFSTWYHSFMGRWWRNIWIRPYTCLV